MAAATKTATVIAKMLDFRIPPEQVGSFDLDAEWKAFLKAMGGARHNTRDNRNTFHYLAAFLTNHGAEVRWCNDCGEHIATVAMSRTYATICAKCAEKYKACETDGCGRRTLTPYTVMNAQNENNDICAHCVDRGGFAHCAKCSVYYSAYSTVATALHLHICDCLKVEADGFTIRNDGQPALANDTRATVQMPGGVISTTGIFSIRNYLGDQGLWDAYYKAEVIGNDWQAKDGNWTKRVVKALYKDGSANKLTKDQMSMVGTIAARHTSASEPYYLEVTRNFARSARDFHHAGSCWWSGYEYSKCTLKTLGGFGMRTFVSADSATTSGRAWVIPLKKSDNNTLVPTSDVDGHDAFIVFNGYGNLQGYAAARLLAHMAGWTYKQDTEFAAGQMSVNSQSGYIVAPQDVLANYTVGYLHIYNKHRNPWA